MWESSLQLVIDIGGEITKSWVAKGGKSLPCLVSFLVKGLFRQEKLRSGIGGIGRRPGHSLPANQLIEDVGTELEELNGGEP